MGGQKTVLCQLVSDLAASVSLHSLLSFLCFGRLYFCGSFYQRFLIYFFFKSPLSTQTSVSFGLMLVILLDILEVMTFVYLFPYFVVGAVYSSLSVMTR